MNGCSPASSECAAGPPQPGGAPGTLEGTGALLCGSLLHPSPGALLRASPGQSGFRGVEQLGSVWPGQQPPSPPASPLVPLQENSDTFSVSHPVVLAVRMAQVIPQRAEGRPRTMGDQCGIVGERRTGAALSGLPHSNLSRLCSAINASC